ncbi:MAG: hypothetical protein ABIA02_01685 [Candidatus Falkowbacteria bacterium]
MKSPEQFDFSKEEDQKKFEKLPEEEKQKKINWTQEDAEKMKSLVESGKAKNYEEAEKMIAIEDIQMSLDMLDITQYSFYYFEQGEAKFDEKLINKDNFETLKYFEKELVEICDDFSKIINKFEKIFSEKNIDSEKIRDANRHLNYEFKYHGRPTVMILEKFRSTMDSLSFDEILNTLESNEKSYFHLDPLINEFVAQKILPINLKRFLESSLSDLADPNILLEKIKDQDVNGEAIEMILDKYGDRIDLSKHTLFGPDSIFKNIKDRSKKEQQAVSLMVENKIKKLEEELDDIIDRRNKSNWSSYTPGYSIDKMRAPIEAMEKAANSKIVTENYENKLERIGKLKHYMETYASFIRSDFEKNMSETEVLLDKLTNKKVESIKGKGLEFAHDKSATGARRVYLDGKHIFSLGSGSVFSDKATNGEIISYLTRERMDSDHVKGTQNKDIIYVWKKGWNAPKQIFEDHAWSSERYFRIFPPEVTPDGKIKIKRINGEETIEEELDVK